MHIQERLTLSSIKRLGIDHQFDTSVRANAVRGRLAMPWPIATHRHGEQLVSWYAHRHQSIEDRECLRGGQLVMRSGGGGSFAESSRRSLAAQVAELVAIGTCPEQTCCPTGIQFESHRHPSELVRREC